MNKEIKIEVTVSLEDFFCSENERSHTFQEAMENALLNKMSEGEWVQENIAYYIFDRLYNDVFRSEMLAIQEAVRKDIHNRPALDKWKIDSHPVIKKAVEEGLLEIKDEVQNEAKKLAIKYMEDDSTGYPSFFHTVATATVDKVYNLFLTAMLESKSKGVSQ